AVAKRLLGELNRPADVEGRRVFPTVSIGIAIGPGQHRDVSELLQDADTALYVAKARGKAQFALFDDDMRTRAIARLELETDLRQALERQEFEVYYQPKVNLQDCRVAGFEALVRWKHPRRGLLSPGDFITAAEDIGVTVPLGYWVLEQSCR